MTLMSATSGNASFDLVAGGSATADRFGYTVRGIDATSPLAVGTITGSASVTSGSANNAVTAATSTGMTAHVSGMFRISTGGTIIPSIALTTATVTAVMKAGTWFKVTKIGESSESYLGAWT